MTEKDFDAILEKLDHAAQRKRDVKQAAKRAEMEAIQLEYVAYYDGAYDAIKAVKNALQKEGADDAVN